MPHIPLISISCSYIFSYYNFRFLSSRKINFNLCGTFLCKINEYMMMMLIFWYKIPVCKTEIIKNYLCTFPWGLQSFAQFFLLLPLCEKYLLCPFSIFYKASRRVKKSLFAATSAIVLKLYEYLLQFTKESNDYADASWNGCKGG